MRRLFQPRLKHTFLLNGARGINPICGGLAGEVKIVLPPPVTSDVFVSSDDFVVIGSDDLIITSISNQPPVEASLESIVSSDDLVIVSSDNLILAGQLGA